MKKIIAMVLALIMVCSLATVAFADDATTPSSTDASFGKTYKITNAGTVSPAETFTFKFTADSITDSNANLTVANMPAIPDSTVTFAQGEATAAGLEKDVAVALSGVNWPGVGVYVYKVTEVKGNTAGVDYNDESTQYLKVTVAYSQETNTYYTAFVSLNLEDADGDGQTDDKSNGFVNEYSAGSLEIGKKVTGNLGDQSKLFDITVVFNSTDPVQAPITATGAESFVIYPAGYTGEKEAGDVLWEEVKSGETVTGYTATRKISLKHDAKVTFANIPYEVTYTATETDYTGQAAGAYESPAIRVDGTETVAKKSGTFAVEGAIDDAAEAVEFINNKETAVDTGIALDSAPYFLMLICAVIGMVALVSKKRYEV